MLGPQFGQLKSYFQNQKIFNEGQIGNVGYLVKKGEVTIYKKIKGKKVVLSRLGPGEIFGEMGIITEAPRTAYAEASEYCDLVIIDKPTLNAMLEKSPKMVQTITLLLMKRLASTLVMLDPKKKESLSAKKRLSVYSLLELMAQIELEISYKSLKKKAKEIAKANDKELDTAVKELKAKEILDFTFKFLKNSELSGSTQKVIQITDLEGLEIEVRKWGKTVKGMG